MPGNIVLVLSNFPRRKVAHFDHAITRAFSARLIVSRHAKILGKPPV
jgi:hypothetical protein